MKTVVLVSAFLTIGEVYAFAPNNQQSTSGSSLVGRNNYNRNNRITHSGFTDESFTLKLNAWSPFKKEVEVEEVAAEVVIEPGPLDAKNAAAAVVWVALVTWAFLLAPGAIGSDADNQMIQRLISQPVPRPEEINELWFAIWNTFAVVPAVLAALTAPTGKNQRLSSAPFLLGSAAFGYFALGPYYATRTVRTEAVNTDDLGWASRNVFENKIFAFALLALTISIPFSADIIVPGFDFSAKAADFASIASQSRFISVAATDIGIMSILTSILISEDCKLRGWGDKAIPLLIGTLLLPVLGPCAYLAARPGFADEIE